MATCRGPFLATEARAKRRNFFSQTKKGEDCDSSEMNTAERGRLLFSKNTQTISVDRLHVEKDKLDFSSRRILSDEKEFRQTIDPRIPPILTQRQNSQEHSSIDSILQDSTNRNSLLTSDHQNNHMKKGLGKHMRTMNEEEQKRSVERLYLGTRIY